MAEELRSITVICDVDTNKRTDTMRREVQTREGAVEALASFLDLPTPVWPASSSEAIVLVPMTYEDYEAIKRDADWEGKPVAAYLVDHARGRTRRGC